MKSEHSVVSYKVDLILALSLLSVKEESLLISRTKPRFTKFQESGFLDTNDNLFGEEGPEIDEERFQYYSPVGFYSFFGFLRKILTKII